MMKSPAESFRDERDERIAANVDDRALNDSSQAFLNETIRAKYSYNFDWLSRPIIQYPQDVVAMQELVWRVRPDLIIETGIAHGGSLIFSATMLSILDYCDAVRSGESLNPRASRRKVLGVDIDIRPHNREAIAAHPMSHLIEMVQGSSIAPDIVDRVRNIAKGYQRVLVCLDSNHTHDHVLAELNAYAALVSMHSYCVVFDTVIEHLPDSACEDRPWARGNNPLTAVEHFLSTLRQTRIPAADGDRLMFEVDSHIDNKLLVSVAPRGYLRRVQPQQA
jgi:cephalosporin hydroxylase